MTATDTQSGAAMQSRLSIPAGLEPTARQFTVRRAPGATTATVRLTVIDRCGEWSTLVGGGIGGW